MWQTKINYEDKFKIMKILTNKIEKKIRCKRKKKGNGKERKNRG
jgi:hypothetical protein